MVKSTQNNLATPIIEAASFAQAKITYKLFWKCTNPVLTCICLSQEDFE